MDDMVACPNCAEQILRNAIMCRFCHRGVSSRHFRKCLFCSEMVRQLARKCRYCQANLPYWSGPSQGAPVPSPRTDPEGGAEVALREPELEVQVSAVSGIDQTT